MSHNYLKNQLSDRNLSFLEELRRVEEVSTRLQTISWIWGGLTVDILENRFLREHDDLDYLTLGLHERIPEFIRLFNNHGWQTKILENGDLKLKQKDVKIQLGHVEVFGKARWTHNGDKGSNWFPQSWLNTRTLYFYGTEVHAVEPEFQYVLLERPQMLNPFWDCREKDIVAKTYLQEWIEKKGTIPNSLFEEVSEQENNLLRPVAEIL